MRSCFPLCMTRPKPRLRRPDSGLSGRKNLIGRSTEFVIGSSTTNTTEMCPLFGSWEIEATVGPSGGFGPPPET